MQANLIKLIKFINGTLISRQRCHSKGKGASRRDFLISNMGFIKFLSLQGLRRVSSGCETSRFLFLLELSKSSMTSFRVCDNCLWMQTMPKFINKSLWMVLVSKGGEGSIEIQREKELKKDEYKGPWVHDVGKIEVKLGLQLWLWCVQI